MTLLGSPNPWARFTAQRLLVAHADPTEVAPQLREWLSRLPRTEATARARLHALWTLDGIGALPSELLEEALAHPVPELVASVLEVAERRLATNANLRGMVVRLMAHENPEVRFRATLAIGFSPESAEAVEALGDVLLRDGHWEWSRRAALSSLRDGEITVLKRLLTAAGSISDRASTSRSPGEVAASASSNEATSAGLPETIRDLAALATARSVIMGRPSFNELAALTAEARLSERLRILLLEGMFAGLQRAGSAPVISPQAREIFARHASSPSRPLLAAAWRLARTLGLPTSADEAAVLRDARREAADESLPIAQRLEAIELLGLGEFREVAPVLFAVLRGTQPFRVQETIIAILRQHRDPPVAEALIESWPVLAPTLRPTVVNLLVYRHAFHEALMNAIESGRLGLGELNLDLEHRRELLRKAAPAIRERAARVISDEEYAHRSAVVEQWLKALPSDGDGARGRPIFERICAQCHRAQGTGHDVGPDLTSLSHRSAEDLLSNVLDPNMAVNPAYAAYTAELRDGEQETGILIAENETSVTLLQALGRRVEIPRSRIITLRSEGRSLMPDGLEAGLTPQDMRDLIAFLQEGKL